MPKKITEQEYSEYEKILKKYQRIRRNIIKAHNVITQNSKQSTARLPQLVAPERQAKISLPRFRISGRMVFRNKMKQLKKLVTMGERGFYRDIKSGYLELWRLWIFGDDPDLGHGGRYSAEQIRLQDKKTQEAMHLYNRMVGMSPTLFTYMRDKEFIRAFKYYYNEMSEKGRSVSESFIQNTDKFLDLMDKTPKEQKQAIENLLEGKKYKGYLDFNIIKDIIQGETYTKDTFRKAGNVSKTFRPKKVSETVKSRYAK